MVSSLSADETRMLVTVSPPPMMANPLSGVASGWNSCRLRVQLRQMMLDSALAKLYHVETKRINEAVKNNMEKFPERFSWKLTEEESKMFLVEIFDQKNIETRGGRYRCPRVFYRTRSRYACHNIKI